MQKPYSSSVWFILAVLVTFFIFTGEAFPQAGTIKPAEIGWAMPAFTLPAYQGENVSISDLKGKNILLVFPRGHVSDSIHWCNICQYQYAELAELENTKHIKQKYNLEILFVLPYDRPAIQDWVNSFPQQLEEVETWKNPPDLGKLSDGEKRWMEKSRVLFPKSFHMAKDNIPTPLPILIDADRAVSKGLDLFRTEWDRSKVDQNIPTIYIVDESGILQFKYMSQKTTDRPNADYLLKYIERMILNK